MRLSSQQEGEPPIHNNSVAKTKYYLQFASLCIPPVEKNRCRQFPNPKGHTQTTREAKGNNIPPKFIINANPVHSVPILLLMRAQPRSLCPGRNTPLRLTLAPQKAIGPPGHRATRIGRIVLAAGLFRCDPRVDFTTRGVGAGGSDDACRGAREDLCGTGLRRRVGDLEAFVVVLVFFICRSDFARILLGCFRLILPL